MTNLLQILMAIALVESNNNDKAQGSYGERSRYQITKETWEEHSSIPFVESKYDDKRQTELTKLIYNGKGEELVEFYSEFPSFDSSNTYIINCGFYP